MSETIQFRWLRSYSRECDGSIVQMEYGEPIFYTLQFRIEQDTGGCDVALTDPWGSWQSVEIKQKKNDY